MHEGICCVLHSKTTGYLHKVLGKTAFQHMSKIKWERARGPEEPTVRDEGHVLVLGCVERTERQGQPQGQPEEAGALRMSDPSPARSPWGFVVSHSSVLVKPTEAKSHADKVTALAFEALGQGLAQLVVAAHR